MATEVEVLTQISEIAEQAWSHNRLSKPINWTQEIELCAWAEELLANLAEKNYSGEPLRQVRFEKQLYPYCDPRVSLSARWEGVNKFWKKGGIDYISFETHPESALEQARKSRWLTMCGSHSEASLPWQVSYELNGFSMRKELKRWVNGNWQTDRKGVVPDKADFNLVKAILINMIDVTENCPAGR